MPYFQGKKGLTVGWEIPYYKREKYGTKVWAN